MSRYGFWLAVCSCAFVWTAAAAWAQQAAPELPLRDSVSQYGITWKLDRQVPVGQFVNGDYYVVGPVTVASVTPRPLYDDEVKNLTDNEKGKYRGKYLRNGSMLNPPTTTQSAYDSRFRNGFTPGLAARFPLEMKPGDSLVSTISLAELQQNQVFPNPTRGNEFTWSRTAAVLTCLQEAVPADAFRPGYCDPTKDRIHLARSLRWDSLPKVEPAANAPSFERMERVFQRVWLDHVYDWESRTVHPSENLPGYGREVGQAVSLAGLLLCCDYPRDRKEKLATLLVQVGIDNWAVAKRSTRNKSGGWPAAGGFGNGRKFPIVFAAVMLQDEEMLNIKKHAPEASFGEDEHTEFGPSWTGARVRFAGQYPLLAKRSPERNADRGPYEHLQPGQWPGNNPIMSEGYRRCCTSICWIGQALAMRLMHAEKVWDHDAFFAYCDRWMTQDDAEHIKAIKAAYPKFSDRPVRQRATWDKFVDGMWAKYRPTFKPDAQETWK